MHEIALDGLATGELARKSVVEIVPGQWSDVLIRKIALPPDAPKSVYHLKQNDVAGAKVPHGARQDTLFLAKIVVNGRPRHMKFPDPKEVARCRPLPDIRGAEISCLTPLSFAANDADSLDFIVVARIAKSSGPRTRISC